jgi:hypothetical protein
MIVEQQGKTVMTASRIFNKQTGTIELMQIEIAKAHRGKKIFSKWANIERDILSTHFGGWNMQSMAISPITNAKYAKLYAARAEVEGSSFITGKIPGFDDAYNKIPGLSEKGVAGSMRKLTTEFGSGWRGLVKVPSMLQRYFGGKAGQAGLGYATTGAFRGNLQRQIFKAGLSKGDRVKAFGQLDDMMREIEKAPDPLRTVLINPTGVAHKAKVQGITYTSALKGTIAHERFHQTLALPEGENLRTVMSYAMTGEASPSWLRKYVKAYGKEYSPDRLMRMEFEEYLAHSISAKWARPTGDAGQALATMAKLEKRSRKAWAHLGETPFWAEVQAPRLEAFVADKETAKWIREAANMKPRDIMRKQKMARAQRDTAMAASVNGLNGGKGHTRYSNKGSN